MAATLWISFFELLQSGASIFGMVFRDSMNFQKEAEPNAPLNDWGRGDLDVYL